MGFATRLCSTTALAREQVPRDTAETLYATHDRAMEMLRELLSRECVDWEELLEFSPRGSAAFRATRLTVFVHLLMHSIRHHAQLATAVRHGGMRADWVWTISSWACSDGWGQSGHVSPFRDTHLVGLPLISIGGSQTPRLSPSARIRLCKLVRSVPNIRAAAETFQST